MEMSFSLVEKHIHQMGDGFFVRWSKARRVLAIKLKVDKRMTWDSSCGVWATRKIRRKREQTNIDIFGSWLKKSISNLFVKISAQNFVNIDLTIPFAMISLCENQLYTTFAMQT